MGALVRAGRRDLERFGYDPKCARCRRERRRQRRRGHADHGGQRGQWDRRTWLRGVGWLVGLGSAGWLMAAAPDEPTGPSKQDVTPRTRRRQPTTATTTPRSSSRAASAALLNNRRGLELAPRAAMDLRAGDVDERLVALLAELLADYRLSVGIFKTGHSMYVKGTRHISQHFTGHACDIGAVDGRPVSASNRAARQLVDQLANLNATERPTEVGSPFTEYAPLKGFFSDSGHRYHIHLGVLRE